MEDSEKNRYIEFLIQKIDEMLTKINDLTARLNKKQ